ncbi:hypothetical protein E2C01_059563 [Portunus trituberculatus]|uniref:Uncharacterized protein n=1 Tax=Portunus trituberculatus TaxID=210409 RepID=A0A5B7H6E8_PORTR|nr:hypothetical protein [Portunus trituberculatus]
MGSLEFLRCASLMLLELRTKDSREVRHIINKFTKLGYPKGLLVELKSKGRRIIERCDREEEEQKISLKE